MHMLFFTSQTLTDPSTRLGPSWAPTIQWLAQANSFSRGEEGINLVRTQGALGKEGSKRLDEFNGWNIRCYIRLAKVFIYALGI